MLSILLHIFQSINWDNKMQTNPESRKQKALTSTNHFFTSFSNNLAKDAGVTQGSNEKFLTDQIIRTGSMPVPIKTHPGQIAFQNSNPISFTFYQYNKSIPKHLNTKKSKFYV